MDTPDYGYYNGADDHTAKYLLDKLTALIGDNSTILDVGCGNGWIGKYLLGRNKNYYGIDASPKGIEIASRIAPGRFFVHDVNNQKLEGYVSQIKFDTIISTEVIEHLYDPDGFVKFCKRILLNNGGGDLIVSTPYHGYLKNLTLAITGKFDSHFTALWHGGHIKFFSRKTLTHLLEENGFTFVAFKGCGRVPFLWKSMLIKVRIAS